MGLDSLELIMAIEERFGVDIPDEDLDELVSANAIVAYLQARTPGKTWAPDFIRLEVPELS
jgi:acyl carrier protein